MPPNIHQTEQEVRQASYEGHFWALDKSGMDSLFGYVKSGLSNLDMIHAVYTKRAEIEQEYGQKLQELSTFIKAKEEDYSGIAAVCNAMSSELECVSNSHLELSQKMEGQVAATLRKKVDHFDDVLDKWSMSLAELFDERELSTLKLLKLQSKYMKERESTRGRSSPAGEALKNQYKAYEEEVNKLSQEWNEEWKSACKTMDTMEYRRFDILKDTLSDYADLTSEIVYIQDKWSEFIRVELEKYNVEEEIQNCISNHGTGSHVPTAREYVVDVHQRRKQKKLQKQALVDGQKTTQRERSNQEIHEEPNLLEKYHQRNSTDSFQEQPNRPISPASVYSDWSAAAEHRAPPPLPPAEKPSEPVETEKATRIRKIISENTGSTAQRGQIKRKPLSKSFMEHHASNQRDGTKQHQEPEKNTKDVSPQKTERNNLNMDDSLESMLRNFEKARGIGNEQAENDISTSIPQPYDNKADAGSIASRRGYINNHRISQKIEKSDPYYSPPEKKGNTTTHISQDVEKPGAALNSVSKENNCLKDSPDQDQSSKYSSQNHGLSNGMVPAVPPKSPRPSPRPSAQVMPEMSQATFSSNQASQHQGNNSHQLLLQQQHQNLPKSAPPSSPLNHHQPSPMVQNQFVSPGYSQQHQQQQQQQQPYTGQPSNQQQQYQYQQQYQQQQNTLIPQNQYSYSRQATQSPMMHPQRSPSMQPQPSPNMYPQRSPMMHPQPSPQPQHHQSVPSQLTPSIQPASAHQYGTHRGPPPSPINTSNNYACSPLPSPSMPYAAPISPGGILPPPQAYGQEYRPEAPLPVYYTDGTPILFWATSDRKHKSNGEGGLSFNPRTLVAVFTEEQGGWWTGATWDPQSNRWIGYGVVPNHEMYRI